MVILKLRCYVCGETIRHDSSFVLASMGDQADRVFVSHEPCSRRMDQVLTMPVRLSVVRGG